MSKKNVIPLHLAKTMEELNKMADVSITQSPRIVVRSLNKLLDEAKLNGNKGDEELSYTMYLRCINASFYVRNHVDYKKDPKYYDGIMGKNLTEIIILTEQLSSSLEERYLLRQKEEEVNKKIRPLEVDAKKVEKKEEPVHINNIYLQLDPKKNFSEGSSKVNKAASTQASQNKATKTDEVASICCSDLYSLLIDKFTELIIMDIRDPVSYLESHIKHPSSINIPEDIIVPGITGPRLEAVIPVASKSLWNKRALVDVIVLMDWDTVPSAQKKPRKVHNLKDAINKWDTTTTLRSEPVILIGGYDNWITHYPTLTTNSDISRTASFSALSQSEISLDIEYPDWNTELNDVAEQKSSIDDRLEQPEIRLNNDLSTRAKPLPSFDRTTKPKIPTVLGSVNMNTESAKPDVMKGGSKWESLDDSESEVTPGFTSQPSINRQLKPKIDMIANSFKDININKENDDQNQKMKDMLIRTESYTNDSLALEQKRLLQEQEFANIRLQREKEAEENMRQELQIKENEILNRLFELETEKKAMDTRNSATKEENENLKKLLQEMSASNQHNEKMRLHLENVIKKNEKRKELDKEVERLRIERITKENQKVINKEPGMPVATIPAKDSSGAAKIIYKSSNNTGNTQLPPVGGQDKTTTSYTKLKDDGASNRRDVQAGRGMSRSQSFSNISYDSGNDSFWQDKSRSEEPSAVRGIRSAESTKVDRLIPTVNRSVKPSLAEVNAAITRDFMPVFGGQGHGLTGLRNLGNTCFMNSVLQCLNHTTSLVSYFNNVNYRADISRNNKHIQDGLLVEEFAAVVRALWNNQYRSISPKDFKRIVSNYQQMFAGFDQHDSQEFLTFLIDGLHEDLNKGNSKKGAELSKEAEAAMDSNLPDHVLANKLWSIYNQLNESVIVDLFQGQTKTTLKCLHCDKTSVRFDTFRFLSLPIPLGTSKCQLKDCIQLYLKEEKMTGSSKWKCPRCKDYREATMKIDLWKVPPILLIHVKRFFYEGVWRKKLQTNIDFPIDGLEFRNYVKGPEQRSKYNLFGVTNHYGTMDGGHYTAFCRHANYGRWFKFDDHEVNEMPQSDVKSPAAYIMYYSLQDNISSKY